ncbi:MAG: hypothetical protein KDA45_05470 [Planctomycetales bacterium]|nr:hypothetical protein [Planctomycetales bacterium]
MLPLFSTFTVLLAQTRIEALNQAFRARDSVGGSESLWMLAVVGPCLLVAIVLFWIVKQRTERVVDDPSRLFAELCRAHYLSVGDRRLLGEIARVKRLVDPSTLLLDAELWTFDPASEARFCQPRVQTRLSQLQGQLFTPGQAAPLDACV